MEMLRLIAWGFATCVLVLGPGVASAQTYPTKVMRIVTAAVGSTNDFVSRIVAKELTRNLGQPVIVENLGGSRAMESVVRVAPDGHTMLFYGSAAWLMPLLRRENYDPVADLAPVTWAVSQPNVVVVHPSLPVKSLRELIALAKARPGELNYSAGTVGAGPHMQMELFKSMAGVDIVRVPYKGTGPSVLALIAGEVNMMIAGLGSVDSHMKSGKLRALAVASIGQCPLTPGLPTVDESGLPGFEAASRMGFLVPAKTPPAITQRLREEIARCLNRREVKELLFKNGIEAVGSTPEEFASLIKTEMAQAAKLIREGRIRIE
ncbi:MAG: tripartite tricarboxylate transporter substrate-binding protein [Candidatus Latescibacterota bacterium]